jgi:hypothetical protein
MSTHTSHDRRTRATFAGVIAMLAAGLALIVSGWGGGEAPAALAHGDGHGHHATAPGKALSAKAAAKQRELYLAMRDLWSQHMEWTYATVTAFVSDSPGFDASVDRLLQNQKDIGDAIKPFYGKAAGNEVTALLTEHIQLAVPVLVAAKNGDDEALNEAVADWYANARRIGSFLAKANPAWKGARKMLKTHITQTVAYAADQLHGDYAKSIVDYDKAEGHMLMLADQLSAGIIKEFPGRFR